MHHVLILLCNVQQLFLVGNAPMLKQCGSDDLASLVADAYERKCVVSSDILLRGMGDKN